jgi:hypothetical protein
MMYARFGSPSQLLEISSSSTVPSPTTPVELITFRDFLPFPQFATNNVTGKIKWQVGWNCNENK